MLHFDDSPCMNANAILCVATDHRVFITIQIVPMRRWSTIYSVAPSNYVRRAWAFTGLIHLCSIPNMNRIILRLFDWFWRQYRSSAANGTP